MAYTVLYRKFRPTKFDEMVGQEHIVKTLKNQIMANRIGHAYLFNGGRGTGKTSTAKIFARAINCLNPKDGEPCNECEICKAILSGSLTDVVEMDAASNNSVEDIRLIRDEVAFLPTVAKYRVYIIDEVHMLSTGAFNALLKTLEEPPEHVKFILATTEPQKLPATILSRCQRFDFKKISVENIIKRLKIVAKESNIEITDQALKMIAVLAEGALRDGISILERCIQEQNGEINEDTVRDLIGIPKLTYINKIIEAIINKNPEQIIQITKELIEQGKDVDNFLWEIIKYLRDILLFKATGKAELYNEEEIKEIKKLSDNISKDRLLKLIYSLSELSNTLKWSSQKTIMFQTGIIKECIDEAEKEEVQKVKKEENIDIPKKEIINKEKTEVAQMPKVELNNVSKETIKAEKLQVKENVKPGYLSYWSKVLDDLRKDGKIMIYTNLIGTKAKKKNDMIVEVEFQNKLTSFGKTVLEKYENKAEIEKRVSLEEGNQMQIKYVNGSEKPKQSYSSAVNPLEELAKDSDITINIIDE